MHACKQTKDLKKDIFSEKHLALKYKLIKNFYFFKNFHRLPEILDEQPRRILDRDSN